MVFYPVLIKNCVINFEIHTDQELNESIYNKIEIIKDISEQCYIFIHENLIYHIVVFDKCINLAQ